MSFRRATLAMILCAAACGSESEQLLTFEVPSEGGKADNLKHLYVKFDVTYERIIAIPEPDLVNQRLSTLNESVAVFPVSGTDEIIVNGEVYVVRALGGSVDFELKTPDGLLNTFTEMAFTLWYRPEGSSDQWKPVLATDDDTGKHFSYFNDFYYAGSHLTLEGTDASGKEDLFDDDLKVAEGSELGILPIPVRDWGDIEGTYPFEGTFEFKVPRR